MAFGRKDNITPEEHLLRLIEKPAGVEETPSQNGGLTVVLGRKRGFSPKIIINGLLAFPVIILELGKRISLKTVNRFCLVMITVLLGYAIWSVVLAETPAIDEPNIKVPPVVEPEKPPDINEFYEKIERDIFMDMYKPPVVETTKTSPSGPITVPPTVPEVKPTISEVLKNLKLIGIIWEPQSVTSGLVLIDNGSDVFCLAIGDTFGTNVEHAGNMRNVNIEVKEISKDKVTLRYENEEETVKLTDK